MWVLCQRSLGNDRSDGHSDFEDGRFHVVIYVEQGGLFSGVVGIGLRAGTLTSAV